jgi:hypothetical protein
MKRWTHFTQPLPSDDRGILVHTNYAIESGSSFMIFLVIQKLIGGALQTESWKSHKPNFIFENKKSRLKR